MKQVLIRRGTPIVVDVPAPQAADNAVLVKVAFSLISTGTETAGMSASGKSLLRQVWEEPGKLVRGLRLVRDAGVRRAMAIVHSELEAGHAAGYSCSGTVLECGRQVEGLAPGDRVACAGANKANHAQIVSVPQNLVARVPEHCDLESAASATIGAIALQGVRRADVRLGENVAVIGLGLIGQITIQLLNAAGCRTIGTDIEPSRVALASSLGMNAGVETETGDPVRAVLNFTQDRGTDAVIVAASSQSEGVLQQAMRMVRKRGKVVVVGAVPLQVDRSPFYEKEADLLISCSYGPGRYDPAYEEEGRDYPYAYVRWTENRNMSEYLRLVAEQKLDFKALVGNIRPLTEAPEAYSDLSAKKHVAVLLSTGSEESPEILRPRVNIERAPRSSNGTLRTGVVGAGSFARAIHLPNLERSGLFAISAVASRTSANAWNVARQYGAKYASTSADEVFRDPDLDLILISSRHDSHARLATEAAGHDKAVLLEKPAALTKAELEDLLKAFRSSNTMLVVGFNRRFSPLIRSAKSVLDQRSGPVLITYRMNAGYIPPDSWIQGPEGGGRIIGEACHIFDLFNYLVGGFPEEITALPARTREGLGPFTDNFAASMRYSDGSLCTLTYTSIGSTELSKESMEAFFDGKSVVLDDYRRLHFYGCSRRALHPPQQEKGHVEELQAVAAYLREEGPLPMTLEEIEAATNTSFIIDELVRNGTCVE